MIGEPAFTNAAVHSHPTPWAIIEMDVSDSRHGHHRHIDLVYICRATSGTLTAQVAEVGGAQWVAAADLPGLSTRTDLTDLVATATKWAQAQA